MDDAAVELQNELDGFSNRTQGSLEIQIVKVSSVYVNRKFQTISEKLLERRW